MSSLSLYPSLSVCVQEFHLKDVESVKKAVRFSNVVVNLIGRDYETRCTQTNKQTNKQTNTHTHTHPPPPSLSLCRNFKFREVQEEGARVIAEACRETGVERLVHFSALNASSSSPSHFLQAKVS